jgi:cell division protein FtsQ
MARKSAKRRHRRGRFGFFYKLFSILVICIVILVALTLFFKVDTIKISGESRYTEQQILETSGVETGENLFMLNKYSIANRLNEKLPYIEEVRINRKLPDTLLIDVTECAHTYALTQDGTAWLISSNGKIVDSCTPADAKDLPSIDGCKLQKPSVSSKIALSSGSQTRLNSLLSLLKALEDANLTDQVNTIHLDSAAELSMDYGGRFTVKLLYGVDYAYKLRNLTAVIDALQTNETGTIDLTKDGEAHFLPD